MRKIIFPSAKIVSRDMQAVGKLPAIIYPVDQKSMIELFTEQYFGKGQADCFDIVTFEAHETVTSRIQSSEKVRIWRLDELKDLGYTVYYGLEKAEIKEGDRVIINFADVIVFEKHEELLEEDCCFFSDEDPSSQWSYFQEQQGRIVEVYDHLPANQVESRKMFIGLFYLAKPLLFMDLLAQDLKEPGESGVDSFYKAVMAYSNLRPLKMVEPKEWFDIGHIDRYYDAQLAIKSRTFNHITIDRSRGTLTKTSDDKEKLINEIKWYLKLPADIEYLRPRIFSYSLAYSQPYVTMEYYAYHTLHEMYLYGELEEANWRNIFRRIHFILHDMARYRAHGKGMSDSLGEMYIHKTIRRLERVREEGLAKVDLERPLVVNGCRFQPLAKVMEVIPKLADKMLMDCEEFVIIHGDLCFANILVDPNYSFVKCIDPRGSFGKFDIYGDRRYELAKLMHSMDGKYDYIIKNLFDLQCKGNKIDYTFKERQTGVEVYDIFLEFFQEDIAGKMPELKLLEALLFLSMIPLHSESSGHQLMMLATGLRLLNEVEDITC